MWARAASLVVAGAALMLPWPSLADTATQAEDATSAPVPRSFLAGWFNPTTAPFIPIPEIGVDPDSGTTLGILPVWVHTDEQSEIRRIIAPDLIYNPYFGIGAHFRIYEYPSQDQQWSMVAGVSERVQREFDTELQWGRLRKTRWSFNTSLIYDRDGTPRFFGIGNESLATAETNYTASEGLVQGQIGFNLSRTWQLQYTLREEVVDVLPGTLAHIASINTRFADILGIGTNYEVLNRFALVHDSRDDLVIPTRGTQWFLYGGLASRRGAFNDSMDSEVGLDWREYWTLDSRLVLAAHSAWRYLPSAHAVPFWALSGIGGDTSQVGGEQPLRGFGEGRFYDRDSFSASIEARETVASFHVMATYVDLQLTPFIDVGRVFHSSGTDFLEQLHHVFGLGFRGVARPFVVGYVDIGYGSEGVAAFTGLYYPF
jgi:outer membrane protein assembly factor BamA